MSKKTADKPTPTTESKDWTGDPLYRYFRSEGMDEKETGVFPVCMSSEYPADQPARSIHVAWGIVKKEGDMFREVMSHDPADVDLTRMNHPNRASMIDEHVDKRHLGYIKGAKLSQDKRTRGLVAFDLVTDLSKTRCEQVRKDSRSNWSMGYKHTRYLGERMAEDGKPAHFFAWMATDISSTATPADPTAQTGRSAGDKKVPCFDCGTRCMRSDLTETDGVLLCDDCVSAETPVKRNVDTSRMFRVKDGTEVSYNDLNQAVQSAANSDKRFKSKESNGYGPYVQDIVENDGNLKAIVSTDKSKLFEVDFTYDGKTATLGSASEVAKKTTYEPTLRSVDDRMFRAKAKDGTETKISHREVSSAVYKAADSDKRFKAERNNGNKYSDFHIHDVHQAGDEMRAIIQSPAWSGPYYEVEFEYDSGEATLGESQEVEPKQTFEPVERSLNPTTQWVRKESKNVDSEKLLSEANAEIARKENLTKNNMALKTAAELAAEAPEAVAQIRTEAEKQTRTAVVSEYDKRTALVDAANTEVRALAETAMKDFGQLWNGPKGEVIVVGAEIRKLEADICRRDHTHDAVERRTDFKRGLDKLTTGAYPPKDPAKAAYLPDELASRCSLRSLYNRAAREQESGRCFDVFMPKDGAEHEADKQMRSNAQSFPGGFGHAVQGCLLPVNMPCKGPRQIGRSFRGQAGRMQRDSLASDFATAGALIAPEYRFPSIELLYNYMALSKAGITMISGVTGSPIVMPRMVNGTNSQSLPEGVILAEYDQLYDQVKFSPHRLGSKQIWTRLAMLQAGEDFEALVINDHMRINALRFDYLILNGQGAADEPLGLMNQPGIGVVTFAGSASAAYKNCVALETAIRKANIDEEPTFITTSVARGTLRVTPATLTGSTVISGSTNAIWSNDEIIGRAAVDSQQVPNDALVCLVGRHVVGMQWGGWQTVIDTLSLADADKIKLSMNTYVDSNLRHPQAVSRSSDPLTSLS